FASTADPSSSHCPLLLYLSNTFSLLFDHDFQVYACLVGLINNDFLDKTHTASKISSTILRFFLQNLCKMKFRSRELNHPWLRILYHLDPYDFRPNFYNSQVNAWLFCDWPILLFESMTSWNLIRIVDLFLLYGRKELYKWILFYFNILFKLLNTSQIDQQENDSFNISQIEMQLNVLIKDENIIYENRKSFSTIKRLDITNKNISKLGKKFLPLILHGDINDQKSHQDLIYTFSFLDLKKAWPSPLINSTEWNTLVSWLPENTQLLSLELSYCSNIDGWSLKTLYNKSEECEPILILIKTVCESIFGGFITQPLKSRRSKPGQVKCFGTGESFVFSIRPKLKKYPWKILQDYDTTFNIESSNPSREPDTPLRDAKKKSRLRFRKLKILKKMLTKQTNISLRDPELVALNDKSYSEEMNNSNKPLLPHMCVNDSCSEGPNEIFAVADEKSIAIGGGCKSETQQQLNSISIKADVSIVSGELYSVLENPIGMRHTRPQCNW
ncbi:hypothetical protein MXB_2702, partial [Myxobolus squamalis]